ncbi:MAG: amidohydrolase family protein [Gemmatimonadales bacterium]|nr:amidohydrolase family protein [Gemmatimonadales bacterium]
MSWIASIGAGLLWAAMPGLVMAQDGPITIFAGRVIDGQGAVHRNATVVVDRGRILRIEPRKLDAPSYDFPRATIVPGLIDLHVHPTWYINRKGRLHLSEDGDSPATATLAAAANLYRTLMAGFTTVASLGAPEDLDIRDAIAAGGMPGPRLLTSLAPITDSALTPAQLRGQVRERVAAGADLIKVFASARLADGGEPTFRPEQLEAICHEARSAGVRTFVHAHRDESIHAAVEAGCDGIEHGLFATRASMDLMASKEASFGPQCSLVFRNYLDNRRWFHGLPGMGDDFFAAMDRAAPLAIGVVREAAGVPSLRLGFGTDAFAGSHGRNADDLVCRVRQAGQRPMDAILSATSVNARILGLDKEIGRLAPGYQADLVVLDGNPLDDITAVQRVLVVMRGGRVYRHDPTSSDFRAFR